MYLLKTEEGFASLNTEKDFYGIAPTSFCISSKDKNFDFLVPEILNRVKNESDDFFAFGITKDKKTNIFSFEFLTPYIASYCDYISYTNISDYSMGYGGNLSFYGFYKDINVTIDDIRKNIEYEFFEFYLNPLALYCELYDNQFNFIGRVTGFKGYTIEDSNILKTIGSIKYPIGFEYNEFLNDFQKQYFSNEFRFFKNSLEKIIQIDEFDDVVQLSKGDDFLEFIEKDDFINSFKNILKNMEESDLKKNLEKAFNEDNPCKKFNLDIFAKTDILTFFLR